MNSTLNTQNSTLKKVLITGGSGFLGFAIIKQLREKFPNVEITSFSRKFFLPLIDFKVKQIKIDIADFNLVEKSFDNFDIVFHTAAKAGIWGDYEEYYNANYIGTKNIADICFQNKIPLIYTSSPSVVFDGKDMKNADETAPYPKKFLSHYSKTKALAEKYILDLEKQGLMTIILRPHLIWGEGDNHLVPRILKKAKRLYKIGYKKKLIDTIYIRNAAFGHILAGEKLLQNNNLSGRIYFLTQDEPIGIWDIVNKILEAHGKNKVSKTLPFFLVYSLAFLIESFYFLLRIKKEPPLTCFMVKELSSSHYFNISAIKQDLGYKPIYTIAEGIKFLNP